MINLLEKGYTKKLRSIRMLFNKKHFQKSICIERSCFAMLF